MRCGSPALDAIDVHLCPVNVIVDQEVRCQYRKGGGHRKERHKACGSTDGIFKGMPDSTEVEICALVLPFIRGLPAPINDEMLDLQHCQ